MAGLLDYLQISLEVQHGYLGAEAFSILVILSLSQNFVVTSNSEGTSRELQQIKFNSPGPSCPWQDFSEVPIQQYHSNKSVLQPLNGGFLYMLPDLSEYIYPIIPLMPVSVKVPLLIRSFQSKVCNFWL